jgi:hypothetical protein
LNAGGSAFRFPPFAIRHSQFPFAFCLLPSAFKIASFPFPAHTRRMAKKSDAKSATETQRRRVGGKTADAGSQKSDSLCASVPLRLKSSYLLDTRVVYCGDNLEQLARLPDGQSLTGTVWGETNEKRAFEDAG